MSYRGRVEVLSSLLLTLLVPACHQVAISSGLTASAPEGSSAQPTAEPSPKSTDESAVKPASPATDEATAEVAEEPIGESDATRVSEAIAGRSKELAESELANYDLSFELIRLSDEATEWPDPAEIQLAIEVVEVEKQSTLASLLMEAGFVPNGEAYGALYRLNPDLDPGAIKPGIILRVPAIQGSDYVLARIEAGWRLSIHFDTNLKERIERIVERIDLLLPRLASLSISPFSPMGDREVAIEEMKQIIDWLRVLEIEFDLRSRPLHSNMLRQVHGEAELLESTIDKLIQQKDKLTKEDTDRISEILENMEIRMISFNEAMGPGDPPWRAREVLVRVRILDARAGQEVNQLRVYFVSSALFSKRAKYAEDFDRVSPPIEQRLPEANYRIWASFPGPGSGSSVPATDVVSLKVRKQIDNEPMVVELQVIP